MSRFTVNIGSTFSVMLREHFDGVDVTQADIDTITWALYPVGVTTAVASGSLVVADVIFDTLQTDGRWSKDEEGYNFRHDVAATAIDTPGGYRMEYLFTAQDGSAWYDTRTELTALNVYTVA